ncbi:hypothetical protein GCM10023238_31430 [Streptomyces heliomycini]
MSGTPRRPARTTTRTPPADSGGTGGKDEKNGGSGGTSSGTEEKAPADTGSKVLFQVPAPKVPKGTTSIPTPVPG